MALKLSCVASPWNEVAVDFLALGVAFSEAPLTQEPLATLDRALQGSLGRLLEREEFKGKKDQVLELETLGHLPSARLALVGLGDVQKLSDADLRTLAAKTARQANGVKAKQMALSLPLALSETAAQAVAEGLVMGAYRFTKYLTGDRMPKAQLETATVLVQEDKVETVASALERGSQVGQAICFSRDLVNEPPNELTPRRLAEYAQNVAKHYKLECRVFDRKELRNMGAKLILAVGQGSAHGPRLVHMIYKPAQPSQKRLVVVGKGLTFDSGGLCIKPAAGMEEMKSDMAGAANVIGFMAAVAKLAPSVEVHGIIGAAENMPDGEAYRPGDIFGSLDGKSVEIINTDAEGRLVLADALAYGRGLEPTVMISHATLTGACIVALGQFCSGYYATNDELADSFRKAAKVAGEQFWQLPLLEDLKDKLKSDVADLKHVGDRWGGSITAALFLREFVGETPYVHCDIAGPALADKSYSFYTKGGTGHGVLTLLRFLESMA